MAVHGPNQAIGSLHQASMVLCELQKIRSQLRLCLDLPK